MKILKMLVGLYELYKVQQKVDPRAKPATVVIEAGTQAAATAIADKIARGNPTVNVAVTAATHEAVSALERLAEKRLRK